MAHETGNGLLVIERLLRDREGVWQQIIEERDLRELSGQMLASSAVSLGLYGAVLGASNSFAQALSSTAKLPLLFLATLAICLPTLYLFNLVFGAKLSMMQAVTLILVSVTVTSVLTLAFAPISLFFLISAHNYSFFKLLNVCILALTAVVGLRFLTAGMRTLNHHQEMLRMPPIPPMVPVPAAPPVAPPPVAPPSAEAVPAAPNGGVPAPAGGPVALAVRVPPPAQAPVRPMPVPRSNSMSLLYIWILLFGFVGTQLAWTLRPFFGDPGRPFALFRHIEGTFYADIAHTIGRLFTG
jgi:hypothetical protein